MFSALTFMVRVAPKNYIAATMPWPAKVIYCTFPKFGNRKTRLRRQNPPPTQSELFKILFNPSDYDTENILKKYIYILIESKEATVSDFVPVVYGRILAWHAHVFLRIKCNKSPYFLFGVVTNGRHPKQSAVTGINLNVFTWQPHTQLNLNLWQECINSPVMSFSETARQKCTRECLNWSRDVLHRLPRTVVKLSNYSRLLIKLRHLFLDTQKELLLVQKNMCLPHITYGRGCFCAFLKRFQCT